MLKFLSRLRTRLLRYLSHYCSLNIRYSRHFRPRGRNWRKSEPQRPIAVLWFFAVWKWDLMADYLPEYRVLMARKSGDWEIQKQQLDKLENLTFIVWGYSAPEHVEEYARTRGIPLYRMEDGFIRSVALGCSHVPPLSLILDKQGIYFDATRPSDLEYILNNHDFAANPALMNIAGQLIQTMRTLRISKYNTGIETDVAAILGPKQQYRILVLGQLERDASLQYGMASHWTNIALLRKAHEDYPEAEIIYRPHPDTLYLQEVDSMSGEEAQKPFYRMFADPVILADLFTQVDHVYTMTSLSGLEALLHGLKVTVAGMPFYAGWGLTEDLQSLTRRARKLSLEELFCGAYILYPRYLADIQNPAAGCLRTMGEIAACVFAGASKDIDAVQPSFNPED